MTSQAQASNLYPSNRGLEKDSYARSFFKRHSVGLLWYRAFNLDCVKPELERASNELWYVPVLFCCFPSNPSNLLFLLFAQPKSHNLSLYTTMYLCQYCGRISAIFGAVHSACHAFIISVIWTHCDYSTSSKVLVQSATAKQTLDQLISSTHYTNTFDIMTYVINRKQLLPI